MHDRERRRAHPFKTDAVLPEDSDRMRAGFASTPMWC